MNDMRVMAARGSESNEYIEFAHSHNTKVKIKNGQFLTKKLRFGKKRK